MGFKNIQEKRISRCLEGVALPVEYLAKEQDAPFRKGTAWGVGESGLMLTLDERLHLGSKLHLKLHIPIPALFSPTWQTLPVDAKMIGLTIFNKVTRSGTMERNLSAWTSRMRHRSNATFNLARVDE